jgi:hypothetical protein
MVKISAVAFRRTADARAPNTCRAVFSPFVRTQTGFYSLKPSATYLIFSLEKFNVDVETNSTRSCFYCNISKSISFQYLWSDLVVFTWFVRSILCSCFIYIFFLSYTFLVMKQITSWFRTVGHLDNSIFRHFVMIMLATNFNRTLFVFE